MEHYEIATYGMLLQIAKKIDRKDIAALLQTILNEEVKINTTLTAVMEDDTSTTAQLELARKNWIPELHSVPGAHHI